MHKNSQLQLINDNLNTFINYYVNYNNPARILFSHDYLDYDIPFSVRLSYFRDGHPTWLFLLMFAKL